MSDTLVEFARRLESDVDPMAAVSVVEVAATERRAAFETALDTVVSELFGADPAARRASARMLYRLSEEVPGTLVTRGTELVPALDNDALRPYIAGTLTNTVYEGMRGETFTGDRSDIVRDLAKQVGTERTVPAVRYLSWIAKRWHRVVATVEPTLTDCLSSTDETVRESAARAFALIWAHHLDGTDAVPALLELTGDTNPTVRAHAIAALGNIAFQDRGEDEEPPAAVPDIVAAGTRLLDDDDERVRFDAAACFAEADYWDEAAGESCWADTLDRDRIDPAVDALVGALDDTATPVVRLVTDALWVYARSETRALAPHVDRLVEYGWNETRPNTRAVRRCVKSTAADHPAALLAHVQFFLDRLRQHGDTDAATILGRLAAADSDAVSSAVPLLVDMLGEPTGRRSAAKALADIYRADPTLVPDYVETLVDAIDGTDVRTMGSGWEPLAILAADHSDTATEFALQAVGRLPEREDVPNLRLVYELGEVAPETVQPVVDQLLELIDHERTAVVAAAARSLWYMVLLDDPPRLSQSDIAPLEHRLEALPERARSDAESVIRAAEDTS